MDVLPAQASSVSSELVFSSSKLTCTRDRNQISAELVEHLQVLKHSLRRQSDGTVPEPGDYCPLDFMGRFDAPGDDIIM